MNCIYFTFFIFLHILEESKFTPEVLHVNPVDFLTSKWPISRVARGKTIINFAVLFVNFLIFRPPFNSLQMKLRSRDVKIAESQELKPGSLTIFETSRELKVEKFYKHDMKDG